MALNKAKGNMYGFVDSTWNTIKGACPHGCEYCYMKRWGEQNPVRLDENELKVDLGEGNYIFVGSSCDMWAHDIPDEWIEKTLDHCGEYPSNKYFFQSKNPIRFSEFIAGLRDTVFVTTIETNRWYPQMKNSPDPSIRATSMYHCGYDNIEVTIEPIMDFDHRMFIELIKCVNPQKVNIGANSWNKIKLPEPSTEKLEKFIAELRDITEVHLKPNLKRLSSLSDKERK